MSVISCWDLWILQNWLGPELSLSLGDPLGSDALASIPFSLVSLDILLLFWLLVSLLILFFFFFFLIPCVFLEEESKLKEQLRLELSRITLHRIHALLREGSSGKFKLLLILEFYQIK